MGSTLAVLAKNPLAFNQALAVIGSYSLLRRNSREHTLSMHRLVQAVLFDAMSTEEREQWCKKWEWHYDLRITINGVKVYVETRLFPESFSSRKEPIIYVVQIKPV